MIPSYRNSRLASLTENFQWDGSALAICAKTPCADLGLQSMQMTDATAAKALAGNHAGFYLGSVEPAAVLGCVVDLEAVREAASGFESDGVDESLLRVGVEVVPDEVIRRALL